MNDFILQCIYIGLISMCFISSNAYGNRFSLPLNTSHILEGFLQLFCKFPDAYVKLC